MVKKSGQTLITGWANNSKSKLLVKRLGKKRAVKSVSPQALNRWTTLHLPGWAKKPEQSP
jgi:hypothetical protein